MVWFDLRFVVAGNSTFELPNSTTKSASSDIRRDAFRIVSWCMCETFVFVAIQRRVDVENGRN